MEKRVVRKLNEVVIYAPLESSIFLHDEIRFAVIMCSIMIIWHRKATQSNVLWLWIGPNMSGEIYARLYYHFPIVFQWLPTTLYVSFSLPLTAFFPLPTATALKKLHLILFILFFTQYYRKVSQKLWTNRLWPKPLFNDRISREM